MVPSTHFTTPTTSFVNFGLSKGAPTRLSTSSLISSILRIGSPQFLVALIRSFLFGLIAIPRSVIITSIRSPGPTKVVTLSTIIGIRFLNDGIGRIVHLLNRQFCQPPIPCNIFPSECVTTLAL